MTLSRHFPLACSLGATLLGASACTQSLLLTKDDSGTVLAHQLLQAPNPADDGAYHVRTMYYGSGTDKRRDVYRDSVTIRTAPVDGSAFFGMPPDVQKPRDDYWGFTPKKLPLNARVWYPDGDGPFPLVLVVHGNHNMKDFSDPGYKYLGEFLASKGYIVASVDENFLNGNSRNENDARAWMLLKHLERWRAWNDSAAGPFVHKVDMGNIAIMGHSRGGEAVSHAATFNHLSRYPDDGNVKFNFGFAIKSVVAIAPVDGQYKPAGQLEPLENVNYLVIHGSHDGDVSTFMGLREFQRLRFTDGKPWFKSAWYVYRANHGQWNTVWGNTDGGPISRRYLDLRGLLPPEDQRRFAKVVIGAFLDATLKGKREYLPLFRDHRVAGAWLPKTMYITRFEESNYRLLANYEEDVDLATGSVPGVRIEAESLSTWKENVLDFRVGANQSMFNSAVWLGWNNHIAGKDTTRLGKPASYTISFGDSLASAYHVGDSSSVYLSLAPLFDVPGPRKPPADSTKRGGADSSGRGDRAKPKKAEKDTTPVDLTVELVDADGHRARMPLSRFGVPRRPLEAHVLRRADHEKERYPHDYEIVLQTYVMPLRDFAAATPGFEPARLRSIRLVFDRLVAGTVVVDDIGVSAVSPAFFARAP